MLGFLFDPMRQKRGGRKKKKLSVPTVRTRDGNFRRRAVAGSAEFWKKRKKKGQPR